MGRAAENASTEWRKHRMYDRPCTWLGTSIADAGGLVSRIVELAKDER